jgi:transcriptional regulator with GAF, ATPase, and Fis domain
VQRQAWKRLRIAYLALVLCARNRGTGVALNRYGCPAAPDRLSDSRRSLRGDKRWEGKHADGKRYQGLTENFLAQLTLLFPLPQLDAHGFRSVPSGVLALLLGPIPSDKTHRYLASLSNNSAIENYRDFDTTRYRTQQGNAACSVRPSLLNLETMLNKAVDTLRINSQATTDTPPWRRFLIGESPAIAQLCEVIKLIASKRITVLISGETGTGKEVVARALHAASSRSANPLVAVNCTALPASLVESELFGHAKGAFTGAHLTRMGRFEQANRGTIFLDEIGDLPLDAQAKLLRVLQEQEFERVGSSETVRVDVRVIAASNVDLERAVADRRFREDLYYRLNVVPIHLVPLRERRSDIPLLAQHFLEKTRLAEGGGPKEFSAGALDYLVAQSWPGNVRQLEHVIQMACALSGDRELLDADDFLPRRRLHSASLPTASSPAASGPLVKVGQEGINFDQVVADFEKSLLNQALAMSGGNKARAADLLRIKRTTLLAKIKVFEAATVPHIPAEEEETDLSGPVDLRHMPDSQFVCA